jgi:tRNA threonylcarbamoyladenosine modification (KEOPS) complex Cgi121 subunit
LRSGHKIEPYVIQELDSHVYLVFGGLIQDQSRSIDIKTTLKELENRFTLVGAQLIDFRLIWGYKHIFSALWHAERAKSTNKMISKSFSMEILLYLAGCRQIKKALEMLGVKDNSEKIIGVLVAKTHNRLPEAFQFLKKTVPFAPNVGIIEQFDLKRKWFVEQLINEDYHDATYFSDAEIEKTQLEKVALLALNT